MLTRILVAIIAIPLVIVPVWWGGRWVALLVLFAALIAGYELYRLLQRSGYRPVVWLGLLWLAFLVLYGWLPVWPLLADLSLSTLLTGGLILTLLYSLLLNEAPLDAWASTSFGAIYLGVMLGQALSLRLMQDGLWWLGLGLLITWANDTAAYFVGSALGRRKVWPRWSPKKSWEGTIGGCLFAALIGGLYTWLSPLQVGFTLGMFLGTFGGILAFFGDLSMSMLKRQAGAKDSGNIFPGHGGMLDRIDSLLFVLPFIYQVVLFL